MESTKKERSLVVIELNGGNDALNTIVPYSNGLYYDYRPGISIAQQDVLPINDDYGFNPNMPAVKELWDRGELAVINGIGYPQPNRSHFRSRDIWYTAEPDTIGTEGWLGAAIRNLDAKGENVLTGVNFGRGLPRALVGKGVPVASVGNLETYGLLPDIDDENVRHHAIDALGRMYGPAGARDVVAQALSENGAQALLGADILRTAPERYSSSVEYADTPVSQSLRNASQVMSAGLGTRILYAQHGSFDTHSDELRAHGKLWQDASTAIADFTEDLKEQGLWEETLVLVWSEFGRRVRDNGTGCDHGSGGVAFVFGGAVQGGLFGQYPSLREADLSEGDMAYTTDFRSTYATILDRWLGLDPDPIVHGQFEQFDFIGR